MLARFSPWAARNVPVVLCTDSHAVAPIEHTATSVVPASSRRRRPRRRGSVTRSAVDDLVPDAVDGPQVPGVGRAGLDLLAQVADVHVDGPFGDGTVQAVC